MTTTTRYRYNVMYMTLYVYMYDIVMIIAAMPFITCTNCIIDMYIANVMAVTMPCSLCIDIKLAYNNIMYMSFNMRRVM